MYNSLKRKGLAPKFEHAGIYAILLDREIVYIGKSVNMLQRMAQHYTQLSTSKEHKYKILSEASRRGHDIRFAVLYYASSVDSLEAELGEKDDGYIDHTEDLGDFIESTVFNEKILLNYLFDSNSYVSTGNDNVDEEVETPDFGSSWDFDKDN